MISMAIFTCQVVVLLIAFCLSACQSEIVPCSGDNCVYYIMFKANGKYQKQGFANITLAEDAVRDAVIPLAFEAIFGSVVCRSLSVQACGHDAVCTPGPTNQYHYTCRCVEDYYIETREYNNYSCNATATTETQSTTETDDLVTEADDLVTEETETISSTIKSNRANISSSNYGLIYLTLISVLTIFL